MASRGQEPVTIDLERAIDLLDRQRPKPGEEDLRGFEWRHLWQLCQSDVNETLPDVDAQNPTFSRDGRWLAYGGKRIVIRELPSQAVVKTIQIAATTIAFSPDCQLLASGDDSHVRLWSTESWEEVQSLPEVRYPAVFSADGRWLVTGAVGGYLRIKGHHVIAQCGDRLAARHEASSDGVASRLRVLHRIHPRLGRRIELGRRLAGHTR